jgi:hypothetical protein
MTRITFLAATAAVSLTAFAVTACGGAGTNATGSAGSPKTPDGRSATLGVANNGDLGKMGSPCRPDFGPSDVHGRGARPASNRAERRTRGHAPHRLESGRRSRRGERAG